MCVRLCVNEYGNVNYASDNKCAGLHVGNVCDGRQRCARCQTACVLGGLPNDNINEFMRMDVVLVFVSGFAMIPMTILWKVICNSIEKLRTHEHNRKNAQPLDIIHDRELMLLAAWPKHRPHE